MKMLNERSFLSKDGSVLLFDEKEKDPSQNILPFAYTDVFLNCVSETKKIILHFWEMEDLVILGMKDTRLPFLDRGLKSLQKARFHYVVRNAGGSAVVCDQGVLNVSFILPDLAHTISIDQGYQFMYQWIKDSFADLTNKIEAYEIFDSYCPGEYDLSIGGQKFAGIAQRRVKSGIALMIYLGINGPQEKRSLAIREFYQEGLGADYAADQTYPKIRLNAMSTLSELLGIQLSVEEVKERLTACLTQVYQLDFSQESLKIFLKSPKGQAQMDHQMKRMLTRNQILDKNQA